MKGLERDRVKRRKVRKVEDAYELREPPARYGADFNVKNGGLRPKNTYFWNIFPDISISELGPTPNCKEVPAAQIGDEILDEASFGQDPPLQSEAALGECQIYAKTKP